MLLITSITKDYTKSYKISKKKKKKVMKNVMLLALFFWNGFGSNCFKGLKQHFFYKIVFLKTHHFLDTTFLNIYNISTKQKKISSSKMNIEIGTKRDKIINFYGRIFFFTSFPLNLWGCVFVELGEKSLDIPLFTHQTKENQKLQLLFWGVFLLFFFHRPSFPSNQTYH